MPFSVPFNAYFAPEGLSMQHSSHGKYLGGRNRVGHVNELTVQLWSDLVWASDGRVDALTMFWEILCPSLLNLSEGAYTLFWVTAVAWVMTMSSFEMKWVITGNHVQGLYAIGGGENINDNLEWRVLLWFRHITNIRYQQKRHGALLFVLQEGLASSMDNSKLYNILKRTSRA